ncbi:hypothetical protein BDV93DRAFT_611559 [Ceratobasidium sp. AG-I]|nr:hypothetical protein BDV93DRAFT_611559 [Ceratobasidium sp. AG-I]
MGAQIDEDELCITLPQNLSDDSFVRFQMYTRYTQTLQIQENITWTVGNSTDLILYADRVVLLPRLRRLSVRSVDYSKDQFDWVTALFCESLREINVIPDLYFPPPLSVSTATLWLEAIAARCPNLRVLSFYPYREWNEVEDMLGSAWEAKFKLELQSRITIAKLVLLRHLSINMYLTGPETLTALARLPHLEHLEIDATHPTNSFLPPALSTSNPFPNLQCLGLYNINVENLRTVLLTEYLMRGLTSLSLIIDPHFEGGNYQDLSRWPWDELGRRLPQVTSLTIQLDSIHDEPPCGISETALGHLAKIALEQILFTKTHIIANAPCELLASTWPNITHLHWPDQLAEMTDLVYFASLPHLQHLTLDLNIRSVHNPTSSLEASRFESFRILECSKPDYAEGFEDDQVGGIADFLHLLWPNISLAWPEDATPLCHSRMNLLQDALGTPC